MNNPTPEGGNIRKANSNMTANEIARMERRNATCLSSHVVGGRYLVRDHRIAYTPEDELPTDVVRMIDGKYAPTPRWYGADRFEDLDFAPADAARLAETEAAWNRRAI